jgi:sigma-B regulation protein RsbU (phosphoserine phosphatase)
VALGERQRDLTLLAAAHERLFGEIALAGKLQYTLRRGRQKPPESFMLAAELRPAGPIAHDVFDYFAPDAETLYCLTASVTAHGIPAALLMDRVLPLLHELLLGGMPPAQALENANTIILSYAPIDKSDRKDLSPFVSVFISAISAKDGKLVWASAGKPPPYLVFAGKAQALPWSGDFPLGVQGGIVYHNHKSTLKPGETLVLCGSKLTGLSSPGGEAFGEERLLALLRSSTGNPAQLVASVLSACLAYTGSETPPEDIALLALRWLGGGL